MAVDPINQEQQAQPSKTITLPASRAAQAWDRATDALLAAAEADEATAKAAYEAARLRYQEARQSAHVIRQLRAVARVEGAADASTAPIPLHGGRWSREFDACVNCGGTNYKHGARGYCKRGACEKAAKANREAQTHGN